LCKIIVVYENKILLSHWDFFVSHRVYTSIFDDEFLVNIWRFVAAVLNALLWNAI